MSIGATFDGSDDRLVVVIGSGAAGATIAYELCAAGINVVLLEAGDAVDADDFIQDEWSGDEKLVWNDERAAGGSWRVGRDHPKSPVWQSKVVGGTTTQWLGVSLRFKEHEFHARETYGAIEGAELIDWPLQAADLDPYYQRAETRMCVTGTDGFPSLPPTRNFRLLEKGARRLGYRQVGQGRLAILSAAHEGRGPASHDGFTIQGDRSRAKWCTSYVEIPQALSTGRLDLRPLSRAVELEIGREGKAAAVIYADRDGRRHRQRCAAVVLAANSIESPRLLLASRSGRFPNGLANGSDMVGRCYMRHMMGTVWSIFDHPVWMNRGESMPGLVEDEARHDPARGFVGGYYIELNAISLPALAMLLDPGLWGRELAYALEHYASMAGLIAVGEDLPQMDNRITLVEGREDRFGVPLAKVSFSDHANDVAMRNHGYRSMVEIHKAAGAIRCYESPPFPATHNLGTVRMSADPGSGVVNGFGAAHEVDNLVVSGGPIFPTSGAANPTLTIVALAMRQAEALAARLKQGERAS